MYTSNPLLKPYKQSTVLEQTRWVPIHVGKWINLEQLQEFLLCTQCPTSLSAPRAP